MVKRGLQNPERRLVTWRLRPRAGRAGAVGRPGRTPDSGIVTEPAAAEVDGRKTAPCGPGGPIPGLRRARCPWQRGARPAPAPPAGPEAPAGPPARQP